MVVDEHGSVQGVVTPFDVLEAIAGDFAAETDATFAPADADNDGWLVDGAQDVRHLGAFIGYDLADPSDRYTTVAGLVLAKLERLPERGDRVNHRALMLEVLEMDGRNAGRVRITREATP